MKILVAVKRVVDYNVSIRLKSDGRGVDTDNLKMSINPFDEVAVEEAVRLVEAGKATEVVAVSVGGPKSQDVLRSALAMGADRGILVEHAGETEPLAVARIIKVLVERESPELVLLGKQAIDDDCNQTTQMLAAMLRWGQGAFVSALTLKDGGVTVKREVDGGLEVLQLKLPAVLSVDLRLNQPRFAALPAIMKARKKPLDVIKPEDLGVDITPRLETLSISEPPKREPGVLLNSPAELVATLKSNGVI